MNDNTEKYSSNSPTGRKNVTEDGAEDSPTTAAYEMRNDMKDAISGERIGRNC